MANDTKDRSSISVEKQMHLLNDLVDDLKKAGAEVPDTLSSAIKGLRVAIDTGKDLGKATATASAALAQYNNKVNESCGSDDTCLAMEYHNYQAQAVDYTLNWKNKDSVARAFVRNTLQRYLPQRICQQLDLCKQGD